MCTQTIHFLERQQHHWELCNRCEQLNPLGSLFIQFTIPIHSMLTTGRYNNGALLLVLQWKPLRRGEKQINCDEAMAARKRRRNLNFSLFFSASSSLLCHRLYRVTCQIIEIHYCRCRRIGDGEREKESTTTSGSLEKRQKELSPSNCVFFPILLCVLLQVFRFIRSSLCVRQ